MAFQAGSQETIVSAADTTTILDARAAGGTARVKPGMLTIRGITAPNNTITLQKNNGTVHEITEVVIRNGDEFQNPWDHNFNGTTDTLEIVTSSVSTLHIIVSFIEETP